MSASYVRLEPIGFEGTQWQKHTVNVSVTSNDGVIHYQGYVLTAIADLAHAIAFELKTSALRASEIDLPLQFSSNASVRLLIDHELIEVAEFPASQESTSIVCHITKDVTKWSEPRETSRLQLLISYYGQKATTTIFLGTDEPALYPKLIQTWTWPYGLQSLAFFAFAWSSLIGLAILMLAHIQPLGDTFRLYAVLIAVVTWIAGVLGLPDVAKIPLRPMLRSLYSKTRSKSILPNSLYNRRRVICLALLFLFFLLVCSGAGTVVYCLSIREYYSSLIYSALEETDLTAREATIRQAIKLLPWRKEAQMLFENDAYGLRDLEDMTNFRKYIKEFAQQQDVKQAIRTAPDADHLPFCLSRSLGSTFLNDPVVWYASTIVEGERYDETSLMKEAISILATRKDPVAQIQLRSMQLELMLADPHADDSQIDKAANELQERLEQNYNSRSTHVYQAACDTLAFYYLRNCDRENASRWYGEEISARKHQTTNNGLPLWLRPPDKLMLFYMFASYWNMKGETLGMAKCLLENSSCNPPVEEEERCDYKSMFEERLRTPNPDYQNEAAWTKNTIRENGLNLNILLENSLKKGWRY